MAIRAGDEDEDLKDSSGERKVGIHLCYMSTCGTPFCSSRLGQSLSPIYSKPDMTAY